MGKLPETARDERRHGLRFERFPAGVLGRPRRGATL